MKKTTSLIIIFNILMFSVVIFMYLFFQQENLTSLNKKEQNTYWYLKGKYNNLLVNHLNMDKLRKSHNFDDNYFGLKKLTNELESLIVSDNNLQKQTQNLSLFQSNLKEFNSVFFKEINQISAKINNEYTPNVCTNSKNEVNNDGKIAYLTFDDGPAKYTKQMVELLQQKHVKGTFFLIGRLIKQHPELIKFILEHENMVGNHTLSHDYDYIYDQKKNFISDVTKNYALYNNIAKQTLSNCSNLRHVFRFPGGSNNEFGNFDIRINLIKWLKNSQISWVDWNVEDYGIEHIRDWNYGKKAQNVLNQVDKKLKEDPKNCKIISLTHDFLPDEVKETSLVIDGLKKRGFKFDIFTDQTKLIKNAYFIYP